VRSCDFINNQQILPLLVLLGCYCYSIDTVLPSLRSDFRVQLLCQKDHNNVNVPTQNSVCTVYSWPDSLGSSWIIRRYTPLINPRHYFTVWHTIREVNYIFVLYNYPLYIAFVYICVQCGVHCTPHCSDSTPKAYGLDWWMPSTYTNVSDFFFSYS